MNAPFRPSPIEITAPFYTLFATGPVIFSSFDKDEIDDRISELAKEWLAHRQSGNWKVLVSEPDGHCHDCSPDFFDEPDDPTDLSYEREASAGDRKFQMMKEGA